MTEYYTVVSSIIYPLTFEDVVNVDKIIIQHTHFTQY